MRSSGRVNASWETQRMASLLHRQCRLVATLFHLRHDLPHAVLGLLLDADRSTSTPSARATFVGPVRWAGECPSMPESTWCSVCGALSCNAGSALPSMWLIASLATKPACRAVVAPVRVRFKS